MPWGCGSSNVNYGATVTGNTLTGTHMGYGFGVSGVRDWTVTGNTDRSTHVGHPSAGNCAGTLASPPRGFQSENVAGAGSLQSGFVLNQHLTNLLHITGTPAAISLLASNDKFGMAENEGTALGACRQSPSVFSRPALRRRAGNDVRFTVILLRHRRPGHRSAWLRRRTPRDPRGVRLSGRAGVCRECAAAGADGTTGRSLAAALVGGHGQPVR